MIGNVLTFTADTAVMLISFLGFLGSISDLQIVRIIVILSVVVTYTAGSPAISTWIDNGGILWHLSVLFLFILMSYLLKVDELI